MVRSIFMLSRVGMQQFTLCTIGFNGMTHGSVSHGELRPSRPLRWRYEPQDAALLSFKMQPLLCTSVRVLSVVSGVTGLSMEGNRNSTLMNNSSRELSREFKSVRKSQAAVMIVG